MRPLPRQIENLVLTVRRRLARGRRRLALFLDFDGTLAPIVPTPEEARVLPSLRPILRTLSRRCPLAILSGRDLQDVRKRVGIRGLVYAGNHGWEAAGPSLRYCHPEAPHYRAEARRLARRLLQALRGLPGIRVEAKRYAVAIHYRGANARIARAARERLKRLETPGWRLTSGKKVWEFRPDIPWHKGSFLVWLLRRWGGSRWHERILPLYLGDDETDLEAFRALGGAGLCIWVSPSRGLPPGAHGRLPSPAAVARFLALLNDRCACAEPLRPAKL